MSNENFKDLLDKHELETEKEDGVRKFLTIQLKSSNTIYISEDNISEKPHQSAKSGWRRLADYISESGDSICGMELRLNGLVSTMEKDQAAYFYIYKYIAPMGFPTYKFYGLGSSPNRDFDKIKIVFASEDGNSFAEFRDKEKCGIGLIVNP